MPLEKVNEGYLNQDLLLKYQISQLIISNAWRWRQAGALSVAESYPTSKVRDSSPEYQAATAQEWLGGATPSPRSGAAAKRSYPASEVRGSRKELPSVRGQWRLGGDTPCPRSEASRRSHLAPEARGGDLEEPPQARGQGQQLGGVTHAGGQEQWPGGAS